MNFISKTTVSDRHNNLALKHVLLGYYKRSIQTCKSVSYYLLSHVVNAVCNSCSCLIHSIQWDHQLNWSSCSNNFHRIIHLFQYVLCLLHCYENGPNLFRSEKVEHSLYHGTLYICGFWSTTIVTIRIKIRLSESFGSCFGWV